MPIRKPVKSRACLVEYDIPRDKSMHHTTVAVMVKNAILAAMHSHVRKLPADDPVSQVPLDTLKTSVLPCSAEHFRWLASYVKAGDADLDRETFLRTVYDRILQDIQANRPLGMGEVGR